MCDGDGYKLRVSADELKNIHKLQESFHKVYELIRRYDTRWTTQHGMMARLLQLKKAIVDDFKRHDRNNRKLSSREWVFTNEVYSLLDVVAEVTTGILWNPHQATMPLECICALLDPRRKECSTNHLVNGKSNLKSSAIDDVNSIARVFVEETVGSTSLAAKCGGNGGGGSSGSNPDERPSKKPKVLSDLEERRLARLARSKTKVTSKVTPLGTAKRNTIIHWELRMYLAEDAHPEEDSPFSRSGGVEASTVHARRQAKSKQASRIWRSLLGFTMESSLQAARQGGTSRHWAS